jgi:DNA-binding NarL/FixJ family response regulator
VSLIGNLEDLSLPDILQIISLSKKSGVLNIRRGDEEGKIYLRQGKVILTSSVKNKRNIGKLLMDKRLVSQQQLDEALAAQRHGGMKELLGNQLIKMGFLDQEGLEQIVREQIEESVYYFLTWRDGTFKFDLKGVDDRLEVEIDPQIIISQTGIDTQWLILEGTRLLDERQRFGSPESAATLQAMSPAEAVTVGSIVLVDDDDFFSRQFVEAAGRSGLHTQRLMGVADGREFMAAGGARPDQILVVDVVMPTSDGRGFLGGLELAGYIRREFPSQAMVIITAYPDESVKDELKKIGELPFLLKPDLPAAEMTTERLEAFIREIMGVLPAASSSSVPQVATPTQAETEAESESGIEEMTEEELGEMEGLGLAEERNIEAEIDSAVAALEEDLQKQPAYRAMAEDLVREIRQAQNPSEIGLILLRLASELLDRAILFKASRKEAVSLGGFGFESVSMRNRDGLRNLSIGLEDSRALREAVERLMVLRGPEFPLGDDDLLTMVLGEYVPSAWIIVPARGIEDTVLILYGDSGPASQVIKGGEVLPHFIQLAGLMMNKLYRMARSEG